MKNYFAAGAAYLGMLFLSCGTISSISAQDLEAFDFRAQVAQIPEGQNATPSDQVLNGNYSWRFNLQNTSGGVVSGASITVRSKLNANRFPNVVKFPFSETSQDLPRYTSLSLNALEESTVSVAFTPGFASARIVAPKDVPPVPPRQTVSVLVVPEDSRYDSDLYPNGHIAVRVDGNILAIQNPDTTNGETLDIAEINDGGAFWMIHHVKLKKAYLFEADLLIENSTASYATSKPGVQVGMTSHDETVLPPLTASGSSIDIEDIALRGGITYSVSSETDLNWVGKVQKDFIINYPPVQPVQPPPAQAARTIGYWKNHPAEIDRILIEKPINLGAGDIEILVDNLDVALAFLSGARAEDAREMLTAQLLAAILNLRNGADPLALGTDIREKIVPAAKQFLAEHIGSPVTGKHPDRDLALFLKDALDAFNNSGE